MSVGATPKETLPLSDEQKQAVAKLASTAQLVALLLLLLGGIQIIGGLAWILMAFGLVASSLRVGFFDGLLLFVQGALWALLGLAMLAVSSDFKFLGQFPRFSGNHLRNAAKGLTFFHQVLLGLTILMALVVVVRLLS
jgi:hypothetical protein